MFQLGVNTGFAINRYPEPEVWTSIVADDFGVGVIQFTVTLLDPRWPGDYVLRQAEKIRRLCDEKGIYIQTIFTDAFTRLNHLTSPDPEIRRLWVDWFKKLVDISEVFGAEGVGGHFGILSFKDYDDPGKRMEMLHVGCRNWAEVAEYGASKGLKYLYFEPMSVPREFAETIKETKYILEEANKDIAIPMRLCLDVDHGDLESKNPDDTNPYRWLEELAKDSPVIHLKQSRLDISGHHPFTAEHNAHGRILPDRVLDTLVNAGCKDNTLVLELAHKERWPTDYTVVQDFQESLEYWRAGLARLESRLTVAK
jgi:D-erythrulose 1-phosphate 3-epimerase